MRISDWSSDVCSSDLQCGGADAGAQLGDQGCRQHAVISWKQRTSGLGEAERGLRPSTAWPRLSALHIALTEQATQMLAHRVVADMQMRAQQLHRATLGHRSEEHTSELQSLMRISYAVFCLKKKTHKYPQNHKTQHHLS